MALELTSDFLPSSGTSVQVRWGLVRSRWAHLAIGMLSSGQGLEEGKGLDMHFQRVLTELSFSRDTDTIPQWQVLTLESNEPWFKSQLCCLVAVGP